MGTAIDIIDVRNNRLSCSIPAEGPVGLSGAYFVSGNSLEVRGSSPLWFQQDSHSATILVVRSEELWVHTLGVWFCFFALAALSYMLHMPTLIPSPNVRWISDARMQTYTFASMSLVICCVGVPRFILLFIHGGKLASDYFLCGDPIVKSGAAYALNIGDHGMQWLDCHMVFLFVALVCFQKQRLRQGHPSDTPASL